MQRLFLTIGALAGFLGVGIGAFGAHALKKRLSAELLATFEVAVRYQMYHALALLAVGLLATRLTASPALNIAGWGFVAGIVLFSGSLYAYTLSGAKLFAMITPVGGVAFLVGWCALAWAALKA